MDNLRFTIDKMFKGALKSFSRFPAALISALIVSIVALIRVGMSFETQRSSSLLFDSIQFSFVLGAAFSMAALVFQEIKADKDRRSFLLANIGGLLVALISFFLLYFFGGRVGEDKTMYLSNISMARMGAAIFISIVLFIYIMSRAKSVDSFSDSFFISHRAFIISAIYGLVMMIGLSGVVGAFQALVYRGLDESIYQYLAIVISFLTYAIFLGYFPSFKDTEEVKKIEDQPRFIFVLFDYILIPILMALTVVLLIWSIRVILNGIDVSFNQLSGIAISYVIVGIWLHIMVAKHETGLAKFYKKVYPFAGMLILIFEAWALYVRIKKVGLQTSEYGFLMVWIFALISVILLITLRNRAYRKIAIAAMVLAIIYVLPFIGYQDITFSSQVKRLEKALKDQELLANGEILASQKEIEDTTKFEITDSVDFISYSDKEEKPTWFKKNLNDDKVFKDTFGFEKLYLVDESEEEYVGRNFNLKDGPIDISDYSLSINAKSDEEGQLSSSFEGENGSYEIILSGQGSPSPEIIVKREDIIIIEKDMGEYLSSLLSKYQQKTTSEYQVPYEDMSLLVEDEDISILLVFESINFYQQDDLSTEEYYLEPYGIYLKYK